MCGISGVFTSNKLSHQFIDESIAKLAHRGPDFRQSIRISSNLSFAHSRLAIVDLNERSNQPFHDPLTGNWLIFNGEIYNFKELKKLLPQRDFNTTSDTEVLLYLLSDLNHKEVLNQCNGMFSFAFWDNKNQKLTLARDRFGKKPLFYFYENNILAFASEAKALEPFGKKLEVNHTAVINYIFEISIGKNEQSFFKGIQQVKNGSIATYTMENGNVNHERTEKYWEYPIQNIDIDYPDAVKQLKELIKSAIDIRLSEEVKYASMISGGLDSSTITAFAAEFNPKKIITSISAIYPGDEKDESHFARMVTDKYPNLQPVWIDDIDYKKFKENIKDVIYHLECPLADGSLVSQHILMKKIRDLGIKVILSGNGGDEVFAGYASIFMPPKEIEDLKKGVWLKPSFRMLYHLLPSKIKNYIYRQKHKKLGIITTNKVLSDVWDRFNSFGHKDLLNEYLINGLEHWSLPNLMWYEDRNSMAASIESRCPLLDFRIVEFLLQIPASYKIDLEFTKRILRDATRGIVPQPILERTDKQGFHAPINKWVQYIDKSFLTDEAFKKEFNYLNFKKIENAPFRTYWRTYTLYLWFKEFIQE